VSLHIGLAADAALAAVPVILRTSMTGPNSNVPLCVVAAACALAVALPRVAFAQPETEPARVSARALGYAGIDAYDAGDFDTAAQLLDEAYTVLRVPSLGLWSARALRKQGRWVQAERRLRDVTQLSLEAGELAVQRQARLDALTELTDLEPRVPRLLLKLEGANAGEVTLTLDGAAFDTAQLGTPVAVDPGERQLLGRRGTQQVELAVTLGEAERREVVLVFAAPAGASPAVPPLRSESDAPPVDAAREPTAADFTHDILPWALVGTGGAALAAGGITFALALGDAKRIDANENCANRECSPSEAELVHRFNTFNTVSRITLIGGGLLASAGITLLVLAESEKTDSATAKIHATPSMLWLSGAF
jgi:hypothetical protein